MTLLQCRQLVVVYRVGDSEVIALQGLDLEVGPGEVVGVVGPSGCGKSTLLSVLSGLLRPTGGSVVFDGVDLGAASAGRLDQYRRDAVGFLWQDPARNLIPYLSAEENVGLMPAIAGDGGARETARRLLDRVGLSNRRSHRVQQLSGGEQQRVALAAALASAPSLLLADEPTGALDRSTTEDIFGLLGEIGRQTGLAQVIVSHDPELERYVDRVLSLQDGRVAAERRMVQAADGSSEVRESIVIDSIGRIQLTAEQQEIIGRTGRVEAELVDGELHIRAAHVDDGGANDE